MWIDNHCHLPAGSPELVATLLAEAGEHGVEAFVNVGCDVAGSRDAISVAERFDSVFATAGVHPHDAKNGVAGLRELAARHEVVAIGECGLDYHYNHSDREAQRKAFAEQIRLAHELDKPLVIHTRSASAEAIVICSVVEPRICRADRTGLETIVVVDDSGTVLERHRDSGIGREPVVLLPRAERRLPPDWIISEEAICTAGAVVAIGYRPRGELATTDGVVEAVAINLVVCRPIKGPGYCVAGDSKQHRQAEGRDQICVTHEGNSLPMNGYDASHHIEGRARLMFPFEHEEAPLPLRPTRKGYGLTTKGEAETEAEIADAAGIDWSGLRPREPHSGSSGLPAES